MKRALAIAAGAALAAACNSQVTTISSGQFASPVGLAATSAGDRDLIYIANSGKDGLIALQLCNQALLDGGQQSSTDTCSTNENAQFIPGRIRVFPATIEGAPRTVRVAGARLLLPDGGVPAGGANGEAIAVGADDTITIVDSKSLVDSEHGIGSPRILGAGSDAGVPTLPGVGVDAVAANALDPVTDVETAAASVRVFVATEAPAQLVALTATLDANGNAQAPTLDATCTLDPVVPKKIATVPGSADAVYVADGVGDGVVRIDTASMNGGPCAMTRISAGGRSTRSVALSPPWYETVLDGTGQPRTKDHPAGEILMMVVEPLLSGNVAGRPLDPGGVLFARTSDGALFPVPPYDWRAQTADPSLPPNAPTCGTTPNPGPAGSPLPRPCEPMQPLQPTGIAREAAFVRSIPEDDLCDAQRAGTGLKLGCTVLNFSTTATGHFDLLAAVSSTDGSTTFIDVPNRRFPDPSLDQLVSLSNVTLLTPTASATSPSTFVTDGSGQHTNVVTLSPGDDPAGPLLTIDPSSLIAGVSHTLIWRALWHAPIPGLIRRAGLLSQNADGTLSFRSPPADFSTWTQDPTVQLGPGDVVAFSGWASTDPNCQDLVRTQSANLSTTGTSVYELPIVSISGDTVTLGAVAGSIDLSGACASVDTVAEFRVAGATPWLIMAGPTVSGRATTGIPYVARETRWDYPFNSCDDYPAVDAKGNPLPTVCNGSSCTNANGIPCYDPNSPPVASDDQSFRFTISADAASPGAEFRWQVVHNQGPVTYGDPNNLSGLGAAVLGYSSPRFESLVYTTLTGSNEVMQVDPASLRSDLAAIQAYR